MPAIYCPVEGCGKRMVTPTILEKHLAKSHPDYKASETPVEPVSVTPTENQGNSGEPTAPVDTTEVETSEPVETPPVNSEEQVNSEEAGSEEQAEAQAEVKAEAEIAEETPAPEAPVQPEVAVAPQDDTVLLRSADNRTLEVSIGEAVWIGKEIRVPAHQAQSVRKLLEDGGFFLKD